MSLTTFQATMERIESASERSPIAVFLPTKGDDRVHSVFAATVVSQRQIERRPSNLIGVFHAGMDLRSVAEQIRAGIASVATPKETVQ